MTIFGTNGQFIEGAVHKIEVKKKQKSKTHTDFAFIGDSG
jgi:hypothetical protein